MTHDCGHVVYVLCTWLIVISHGFRACDPVRAHDLFYELWLVAGQGAADSDESADGFHTMTHYESWVAWRERMSHAGLGLREEPLYKGTLGAEDLGSSRNPLSSFIYYTLNTKIFIYHDFGNQDTTVLYKSSDWRCWIGVNGLRYRNRYWAKKNWSLGDYRLPAASITRRGEDCNTTSNLTSS